MNAKRLKGKFVVIEGIDGSGKSTQINLLLDYLKRKEIKYRYIHFPRTDIPMYGQMIASFLRGEFGTVENVNPYLVALLYANDRRDTKPMIARWLSQGYIVLADRYAYSNIAFQCAKARYHKKKEELKKWILDLEFGYNKIPTPDISFFLQVSFKFASKKLSACRSGLDRKYLNGKKDIHESSSILQKRVESEYLKLVETTTDLYLVKCTSKKGKMLPPSIINQKIIDILKSTHIL